jgi:hypothetical protein
MKGITHWKLGLTGAVAAALLLVGGVLIATQVSAISGELSIGSASIEPGGSGTVDLTANVTAAPGLGAWTVDITYDPDVVTPTDCEAEEGGVCNPAFADNVIRVTGAVASGIDEEVVLATITFECGEDEGSSDLSLSAEVFADATIGDPQDIDGTLNDGSIDCETQVAGTPLPTITIVGGNPPSGGDGSLGWLIVGMTLIGLAGVAGYGVFRLRAGA